MGSIAAELRVDGQVLPVLHSTYGVSQGTDERGQANTKVRYSLVLLLLDVPDTPLLKAWAASPTKRLAVDIVFRDAAGGQAVETLHLDAAYCVDYFEVFEAGDLTTGAYQCRVTLADPGGWTLTPGGPGGAWRAPDPRPASEPPVASPVLIAPEAVAALEEASLWARVGTGLLRVLELGASFPAMLAALLLIPRDLNATEPQQPTLPEREARRLAELERRHEAGEALSQEEQAEYLSLLARVRGVHLGTLHDSLELRMRALEQQAPYTLPSRPPNPTAVPKGPRTRINPKQDSDTQQALIRENESALLLAQAGYEVEQNPNVPGTKNPDYLIEGKVFDCYAPNKPNPRAIWTNVKQKIDARQTQRIILNLDDSSVDIDALRSQFAQYPIPDLQEVILIKNERIFHLLP